MRAGSWCRRGDASSQYLYTYDANGHLDVVTESGSGLGAVYTFDYDANVAGDIVAVAVSVNGSVDHVENYTYDANHRMTQVLQSGASVAAKRVDIAYVDNRVGTLTRYADLSGTQLVATSTFSYTGSHISDISHTQGATVLASLGYTYNAAGLVSSLTTDANTAAYSYDATGQLVGVDNSTLPDEGHIYDANGNRTGTGYAVGAGNRQLSDPRFSYTYDDEGNRTAKVDAITGERTEYVWDARNRLDEVKVETSSGAVVKDVDYVYDALNQKIGKIVKNGSGVIVGEEHYGLVSRTPQRSVPVAGMLSQATLDQVSVVTGANGAVTERYVYGPAVDQVLAVDSVGSQVLWMLNDQQGSVHTVISSVGTTLKTVEYDGFGNVVSDSAPTVAVRFLYTGREWDADTQLQNNRARWFDPATGRWLSNDPMGFAAGDVNLQRYVGNGAPNATDPSGLFLIASSQSEADSVIAQLALNGITASAEPFAHLNGIAYAIIIDPSSIEAATNLFRGTSFLNTFNSSTQHEIVRANIFAPALQSGGPITIYNDLKNVKAKLDALIAARLASDELKRLSAENRSRILDIGRPSCMICHGRMNNGAVDYSKMSQNERMWAGRFLAADGIGPSDLERKSVRITAFGPTQMAIGVGDGAGHLATHPWELVTGPILAAYTFVFDQAKFKEGVESVGRSLILEPSRTIGVVGGTILVGGILTYGVVSGLRALLSGVKPLPSLGAPGALPQGLTKAQFEDAARLIRSKAAGVSDDVVVHGSRAAGTAKPTSDIDFALRVSPEKFDELVKARFGKPNPGSAKEKTMLHAIETGKIQAGEAGLRSLRKELQDALGMEVDISIIRTGGPFDNPPTIPIP